MRRFGIDIGNKYSRLVEIDGKTSHSLGSWLTEGQPSRCLLEILNYIQTDCGESRVEGLALSGSSGIALAKQLGLEAINEAHALAAAFNLLHPEVRSVVQIGHSTARYVLLEAKRGGRLYPVEVDSGDKCASTGGLFIEQMALRFDWGSVREMVDMALQAEVAATLSGRCAVFTESDIVHLFQNGVPPESIAAGVHLSQARMYKKSILRNRDLHGRVAFVGGVSRNACMLKYLQSELGEDIFVPDESEDMVAIGAGLLACQNEVDLKPLIESLQAELDKPFEYETSGPLQYVLSKRMRSARKGELPKRISRAALGVDIGSVSTKAALITFDENGKLYVLASHYRWTKGNPLGAVRICIEEIRKKIVKAGWQFDLIVAATTGSGRYLTGDYIGADIIRNEISSQASGALSYDRDVEFILEIGGQDSKYIRMKDEVMIDFEMNKACAGGTGAFIGKQADLLKIALVKFGDVALRGEAPPNLNTNCTVFTEEGIREYQRHNVSKENLAAAVCYAVVHNYLRNLGSHRTISGGKIVFQGAVALNKGVVAAFETILGQKIIVPSNPQITGAIGAARLAYQSDVTSSRFRGFDEIRQTEYSQKLSNCKGCENRCEISRFKLNNEEYLYGDRCGELSDQGNKKTRNDLPDLFDVRERLIAKYCSGPIPEGALRVGIPLAGLTEQYRPLLDKFLRELGFEPVYSVRTNKPLMEKGLNLSTSEPCLPFKVVYGHIAALLEMKGLHAILFPSFISGEQTNPNLKWAQTCPWWQGAPKAIGDKLGMKDRDVLYLTPSLHMIEGERSVRRQFVKIAKALGKNSAEARLALRSALDNLRSFRAEMLDEGKRVLEEIAEKDLRAFVVASRPYILWDPMLNMNIGKKILKMGIVPIPQDFLGLDGVDISDRWGSIFSKQLQLKLAVARLVRENPRLQTVVVTVFGCGPDSFGNPFFRDEVGRPCYVMEIDEHTGDNGVITRLEAFADSSINSQTSKPVEVRANDTILGGSHVQGEILWVPNVNGGGRALTAALRGTGRDARVLPRSPDSSLRSARKLVTENVCLPLLMTLEDILHRIGQSDFDPSKEKFFQGNSNGPCRFGMYLPLQRRILDDLGYQEVGLESLGIKEDDLGIPFKILTWDGLVSADLLENMRMRVRPYEIREGAADECFERFLARLEELLVSEMSRYTGRLATMKVLRRSHLAPFKRLLREAEDAFSSIIDTSLPRLPIVMLVGEFYVRLHNGANEDIIRELERSGVEVWLAPMTEFFGYANWIGGQYAGDRFRRGDHTGEVLFKWGGMRFNAWLAGHDEHELYGAAKPLLTDRYDIPPWEVVAEGEAYCNRDFGGEAICSLGKLAWAAKNGLAGGISIGPLGCLPSNYVTAQIRTMRKDYPDFPVLCLTYDGFPDIKRQDALDNFVAMVLDTSRMDSEESVLFG